jgi:O-antigen/teichoic acid export membrane protein
MKMQTKSAFSILLGSSLLAQAILVGCSILFARLYSPDAFGTLAYVTGVTSIATTVVGLRFDHMAFSRPTDQKRQMYQAAFLFFVLLSVTSIVLAFVATCFLPMNGKELGWLMPFAVANGMYYLCSQWQIAQGAYGSFGRVRVIQAVLQLSIGIALCFVAPDRGLLLAILLSQAIAAILVWAGKDMGQLNVFHRSTFRFLKSNFSPALVNSVSALLQYSTPLAPIVLGPIFFSKQEIGAYFLFSSAFAAPCAIVRRSILSYFNGEVKSADQIRDVLRRTAGSHATAICVLAGAGILAAFVLQLNAVALTGIVFGKDWRPYASLMMPLALFFAADTALQPFSTFLGMWGHERMQMLIEIARFMMTCVAWPLLVFVLKLEFMPAICVYLAFMLVVYVVNCVIVLRAPPKLLGVAVH